MKKIKIFLTIIVMIFCARIGYAEIKINPEVRYQGNLLFIKNNDEFGYDYVVISLNGGKFKKQAQFSIPAGEEHRFELSSFLKSDGERFNIFRYGLLDISISCEVSKEMERGKWKKLGKGFYYGKFK